MVVKNGVLRVYFALGGHLDGRLDGQKWAKIKRKIKLDGHLDGHFLEKYGRFRYRNEQKSGLFCLLFRFRGGIIPRF
jgi:hypothetical protein